MWKQLRQSMRGTPGAAAAEPLASDSPTAPKGRLDDPQLLRRREQLAPPHLDAATREAALARAAQRTPAFAASLRQLDPWQLAAVVDASPACLVRAQVGSGKTAVLSHKLLYLHLIDDVPLDRLLAVTFTNKAAAELRNRILALAPETPLQALQQVGTFHGVARYWLEHRLPLEAVGLRRGFAIVDEQAEQALVGLLIREHGLRIQYPARVLQRLSRFRRSGVVRSGVMKHDDDLAQLDALARAARRDRNVVNFDDLLLLSTELLQHQGLRPTLQWLLLDEAQDCEPRERAFLDAAASADTKRFAVGDPLQSIYAFRGSASTSLRELADEWRARQVALPQNYRSTQPILDAARGVLGLQREGSADALIAVRPDGQPIGLLRQHDPVAEAWLLAASLREHKLAGGRWSDLAVLTRTRRLAEQLAEALRSAGVAARLGVRRDAAHEPAVRWLQLALQTAAHDADPDALRGLLCEGEYALLAKKLWPQAAWRRALAAPNSSRQSVVLLAADFLAGRASSGTDGRDLQFAASWLRRLNEVTAGVPDAGALRAWLWRVLQLDQVLRPTSHRHAAQVAALEGWIEALQQVVAATGWPADVETWQERLRGGLALAALGGLPALRDTAEPLDDAVSVLTLHASKGLEFPFVVVSGCNEGVLPLRAARDPGGPEGTEALAEERRLLYVGLTRARDGVLLTWHGQPGAGQAFAEPSSLLLGVPARLIRESEQVLVDGLAAIRAQRGSDRSAARTGPVADPVPEPVSVPVQFQAQAQAPGQAQAQAPSQAQAQAPGQAQAQAPSQAPAEVGGGEQLSTPDRPVAQASLFTAGTRVLHPRYGKGEVVAADSAEVVVRFGKLGEKSFAALLCPLRLDPS